MLPRLVRILAFLGAVLWALLTNPADAQQPRKHTLPAPSVPLSRDPARNPPNTMGEALRSLAGRSGVVFLGRVDRIDRQPGFVAITFTVLDAILGNPGTTYTLREWPGLWPPGRQRYTLGQRALFFLHAPSSSGLSSPVDGQFGILPLIPTSAGAPPLLDVRWLNARLARTTTDTLAGSAAISFADAKILVNRWNTPGPIPEPAHHPLPVSLPPTPAIAR